MCFRMQRVETECTFCGQGGIKMNVNSTRIEFNSQVTSYMYLPVITYFKARPWRSRMPIHVRACPHERSFSSS